MLQSASGIRARVPRGAFKINFRNPRRDALEGSGMVTVKFNEADFSSEPASSSEFDPSSEVEGESSETDRSSDSDPPITIANTIRPALQKIRQTIGALPMSAKAQHQQGAPLKRSRSAEAEEASDSDEPEIIEVRPVYKPAKKQKLLHQTLLWDSWGRPS